MRKKWNASSVQISSCTVSTEEYNLLVDEWAKTVYLHFCQLSESKILVPETQMPSLAESAGA